MRLLPDVFGVFLCNIASVMQLCTADEPNRWYLGKKLCLFPQTETNFRFLTQKGGGV